MRPPLQTPLDSSALRGLIDAAIAVNETTTLEEAFQVLGEACRDLLDADLVEVVPDDPATARGVDERANGRTRISIPLGTETSAHLIQATWSSQLEEGAAARAVSVLEQLTRLTSLSDRSQRERDHLQLEYVLDGVADGVVLSSPGRARPNAAARAMLAIPDADDFDFRSSAFNPRTLDGEPFDLPAQSMPGQSAMESGKGGRFRIRATALDGRELVLDGSVSPSSNGAIIIFRNVTDEHAQAVLTERYLYALFNSMPIPLTVGDAETRELLAANQAFLDLTGLERSEIIGSMPPFPWWDEHESVENGFQPGSVVRRIYRGADGRPKPVEVLSHGVPGDDGKTALLLGVITDLAEKHRLDQQLVQSGKLAAIGELAAGVAHEINNPLFAILGLTEFLLQESEPDSKAHQRLVLIQETGLEIKEIVRALLDFARENAEERLIVPLEDVIQSTVDLVRRTNAHKGVELVDAYDDADLLVSASPNQLKQIFLNLIANARQAMPNGGIVRVEARREGGFAVATVSDDGPGIEPAVLERIFEPFFTTKRLTGGTGLGLSVSFGIAESHGGTLTVASEPGHGAAFTLRLPVYEEVPHD
jgi:PAS domain S-box-containing protein